MKKNHWKYFFFLSLSQQWKTTLFFRHTRTNWHLKKKPRLMLFSSFNFDLSLPFLFFWHTHKLLVVLLLLSRDMLVKYVCNKKWCTVVLSCKIVSRDFYGTGQVYVALANVFVHFHHNVIIILGLHLMTLQYHRQ